MPSTFGNESAIILNFGAVDYQATVFVDGTRVGDHTGGYDRFSFPIEHALLPHQASHELLVFVYDPTDRNTELDPPTGKQTANPSHIFYTSCSGIWMTVFLEPVPRLHVLRLDISSDMHGQLNVTVIGNQVHSRSRLHVDVLTKDQSSSLVSHEAQDNTIVLQVPDPVLWSPDDPYIYPLRIKYGEDIVYSYAGFRSIGTGKSSRGHPAVTLNEKPLFLWGTLDQGQQSSAT